MKKLWRFVLACLSCRFGLHPRNPARLISSQAYYVTTCHNGDTGWYEKCPRCGRWHHCWALNREMAMEMEYGTFTLTDVQRLEAALGLTRE